MQSLLLKRIQNQMERHESSLVGDKTIVDKADLNAALRAWQDAEARAERNAKELAKVKHDAKLSKVR